MRIILMILFLSSVTFNITSLNQILFTSVYAGEDDHDEEAATEAIIQADVAKRAGIFTEHVSSQTIKQSKVLTGRMMQVPDNTFTIRARFPGIVKSRFPFQLLTLYIDVTYPPVSTVII